MSESRSAAEEVSGHLQFSDAEMDEYQDAEMGMFEVRHTTGFDGDMPDNAPPGLESTPRYDKSQIESVVREALQSCLTPMLDEIARKSQHNGNPGYSGETPQSKPRVGYQRHDLAAKWDKTPEQKGYQRDENDFYGKGMPGFSANGGSYYNEYMGETDGWNDRASHKGQSWGYQNSPTNAKGVDGQRRGYMGPNSRPRYHDLDYHNGSKESDQYNISYGTPREDVGVKVRPFLGRETDWFTYKTHFEALASQACWSEKTKCLKLMGALQGSLTGITAGMPHPFRYDQLIARLDAVHGISNDKEDALMKIGNCN